MKYGVFVVALLLCVSFALAADPPVPPAAPTIDAEVNVSQNTSAPAPPGTSPDNTTNSTTNTPTTTTTSNTSTVKQNETFPDGYVAAGTCYDNIRNGQETGIDCGGLCPACQTAPAPSSDSAPTPQPPQAQSTQSNTVQTTTTPEPPQQPTQFAQQESPAEIITQEEGSSLFFYIFLILTIGILGAGGYAGYLKRFEIMDFVQNLKKPNAKVTVPDQSPEPSTTKKTLSPGAQYVKEQELKGTTPEQIKFGLEQKGWTQEQIDEVFMELV